MELKSALLFCVVISGANMVEVHAANDGQNYPKAKYDLNKNLLQKEGICEPKIRLSHLSDHPNADSDVVYDPPAAVLHLCHSSGSYCENNPRYQCKPYLEEKVEIVFRARRMGKGRSEFKAFTFSNHTQCACMDTWLAPKTN